MADAAWDPALLRDGEEQYPVVRLSWRLKDVALSIREVGAARVLYGSDGSWIGPAPAERIAAYRSLPLTATEFRMIDTNVPAYMR